MSPSGRTLRAIGRVAVAGHGGARVSDTLLLDHDERMAPRGIKRGLRGNDIELAIPADMVLRHDDLLLLDDDATVEVVARPERLIEVRAPDLAALARAAWLVGDHHIPAELGARRVRVRYAEATLSLLSPLNLRLIEIEAPFEPEAGAYAHERSAA